MGKSTLLIATAEDLERDARYVDQLVAHMNADGGTDAGNLRDVIGMFRRAHLAYGHAQKDNAAMLEALKGRDPDWLTKLYNFLLSQFEAEPDGGKAVTPCARPHFEALCDFMAARDAVLAAAEPEEGRD